MQYCHGALQFLSAGGSDSAVLIVVQKHLPHVHAYLCRFCTLATRSNGAAYIFLNVFTQAGQLLDLHGFPKGLTQLLNEGHDTTLHVEVAWLLAFICAGSETHMHTMTKHGAAAAVAQRLMGVQQHGMLMNLLLAMAAAWMDLLRHMCILRKKDTLLIGFGVCNNAGWGR